MYIYTHIYICEIFLKCFMLHFLRPDEKLSKKIPFVAYYGNEDERSIYMKKILLR